MLVYKTMFKMPSGGLKAAVIPRTMHILVGLLTLHLLNTNRLMDFSCFENTVCVGGNKCLPNGVGHRVLSGNPFSPE